MIFFGFSRKIICFLNFGKKLNNNNLLQFRRKREKFGEKKPTSQKTPIFLFKNKNVLTNLKKALKNMVDSGIRTAVTSNICVIQDTKSADLSCFRKRKKNFDYWIEYFPFEKNFPRKIIKKTASSGLVVATGKLNNFRRIKYKMINQYDFHLTWIILTKTRSSNQDIRNFS